MSEYCSLNTDGCAIRQNMWHTKRTNWGKCGNRINVNPEMRECWFSFQVQGPSDSYENIERVEIPFYQTKSHIMNAVRILFSTIGERRSRGAAMSTCG